MALKKEGLTLWRRTILFLKDVKGKENDSVGIFLHYHPTYRSEQTMSKGLHILILELRKCAANSFLSISIFSYFNKITNEQCNKVKVFVGNCRLKTII